LILDLIQDPILDLIQATKKKAGQNAPPFLLENRAVKAIFRDGYRPRRRELAVHPVVSERRQRPESGAR